MATKKKVIHKLDYKHVKVPIPTHQILKVAASIENKTLGDMLSEFADQKKKEHALK